MPKTTTCPRCGTTVRPVLWGSPNFCNHCGMPLNKDAVRAIFIQVVADCIEKDPKLAIDLMKQVCPEKWDVVEKAVLRVAVETLQRHYGDAYDYLAEHDPEAWAALVQMVVGARGPLPEKGSEGSNHRPDTNRKKSTKPRKRARSSGRAGEAGENEPSSQ